ncbi:MAG: DNA cytosine methyltransferase [Pseudomonadota bacterium]
MTRRFLEFFAGGGMARAGLGQEWQCVFSNDFDFKKVAAYQRNWGNRGEVRPGDVGKVRAGDLPAADLAWASFPCQDLSLAGGGAGLKGERSGTFYPFWDLMKQLIDEWKEARDGNNEQTHALPRERAPRVIALENVTGTLTSHGGKDFAAICKAFADVGYTYGAVVIDAALFVPQSRPRFFVVAVRGDIVPDPGLVAPDPLDPFHTRALRRAVKGLSAAVRERWVWWNLPTPHRRTSVFADLIEDKPTSVEWHTPEETDYLIGMMSPINLAKVTAAKRSGHRVVGGVYKRTRRENGVKVQRAEVRFDDVAGCLRTPAGGSSRQLIIVVDGPVVRSRLVSSRETARLMGLPDSYELPRRYNEAYHLTGDGVVVPVVRHLAHHLIEPLLAEDVATAEASAPAKSAVTAA